MSYKKMILALALVVGLSFVALHTGHANALFSSAKGDACNGVGLGTDGCSGGTSTITNIINVVVNLISLVVGIVAVIMIMVAGFKYITSAGDSSKISSAKSTIIYAVIGLVIVAFAQFIVKFVVHTATTPPAKPKTTYLQRA